MKITKIISCIIYLVFLVSCSSNTYEEVSAKIPDVPTYVTDIKPLIDTNCKSCHGANTSQAQYPPLDTYADVKGATDATLGGSVLCRIQNTCGLVMPMSGQLPQTKIDLVKKWSVTGFIEQ